MNIMIYSEHTKMENEMILALPDIGDIEVPDDRADNIDLDAIIAQEMKATEISESEVLELLKKESVELTSEPVCGMEKFNWCAGTSLKIPASAHRQGVFSKARDISKANRSAYEVIYGMTVPYYDYETPTQARYKTAREAKRMWQKELKTAYDAIANHYGSGARIYVFDASGKSGDVWKQSFHFIVRGVGCYENPRNIPLIDKDLFDTSVYCSAGKRQLFRMPYCSKDGKTRFLKRLEIDFELGHYCHDDCDGALETLNERYEDWLPSNCNGEHIVFCPPPKPKQQIASGAEKEVSAEQLTELLECIKNEDLDWDAWVRVIWAIVSVSYKNDLDVGAIARAWSAKSSKYNKQETNFTISRARTTGNTYCMGSLIKWAKESSPDEFRQWASKYMGGAEIDPRDSYCWIDFKRAKSSKTYENLNDLIADVKKDVSRVLVKLLDMEGSYIKKDGDWRSDRVFNVVKGITRGIDFWLKYQEEVVPKKQNSKEPAPAPEKKTKRIKFSALIDNYDIVKEFGYMDCNPDNKDTNCFNNFLPYQAEEYRENDRDERIKPVVNFLREVICNENEELYAWLIKWLAVLIKYPSIKPEVVLVLVSPKEGTGKGTFLRFLEFMLGAYHMVDINSVSEATQRFNMFLYGKRLGVLNEVVSTRDEFIASFQKMKSLITDYRTSFEIKGGAKFNGFSGHAWVFMSNNRDCVVMPRGTRRYCCFEVNGKYAQNEKYFGKLNKQIMNQETANAFVSFLKEQQAEVKDIRGKNIPQTDLQRDMIDVSRPSHEKFLQWVKATYAEQNEMEEEQRLSEEQIIAEDYRGMELYNLYKWWIAEHGERHLMSSCMFFKRINNKSEQLIKKKRSKTGMRYIIDTINGV